MTRRNFLGTGVAAAADPSWNGGRVRHLLPTASHDRLLIKVSFQTPLDVPPVLRLPDRAVPGTRSDTIGLFWSFDVPKRKPATEYPLALSDHRGKLLCDPWSIRTLPHPDDSVSHFRLMIYTCAGGHDGFHVPGDSRPYWVSIANRRKLLQTGLALAPDAIIANGDHVYWDLRFGRAAGKVALGASDWAKRTVGEFQRDIPVLGTPNENMLLKAVTPQICDLYGTMFRSVPVFFIQDDHDYFENDEAIASGVSFPPDDFMLRLAKATQRLYFPEFLPDAGRPRGLPDGDDLAQCYGTLRYGKLAELLLYDCRRGMTLKGPHGVFVPDVVENWLVKRMKESPAAHVVNVPSTPIAWSAGKWGEWYPDLLLDDGRLGTAKPKYFWQQGWKSQHDRLVAASSAMNRIPLFISGDLHALGYGRIEKCGALDLRRNPVHSILSGPIGTGPWGWPSAARGTPPQVPEGLEVDEKLKPLENNGFTITDFYADRIECRMFRWKMDQPESLLSHLESFSHFTIQRPV